MSLASIPQNVIYFHHLLTVQWTFESLLCHEGQLEHTPSSPLSYKPSCSEEPQANPLPIKN